MYFNELEFDFIQRFFFKRVRLFEPRQKNCLTWQNIQGWDFMEFRFEPRITRGKRL